MHQVMVGKWRIECRRLARIGPDRFHPDAEDVALFGKKSRVKKSARLIVEQPTHQEAGVSNRPGSSLFKTCILFIILMAVMHAIVRWPPLPQARLQREQGGQGGRS